MQSILTHCSVLNMIAFSGVLPTCTLSILQVLCICKRDLPGNRKMAKTGCCITSCKGTSSLGTNGQMGQHGATHVMLIEQDAATMYQATWP